MLESCTQLSESRLGAIADLERRVIAADGGRLKLEWLSLRDRSWDRVLWWDGDRLVGFLGAYAFGGADTELAGMVDPACRRRGIGTALVDHAAERLAAAGRHAALLVCPRSTDSGRRFAQSRGATLAASEHAMALEGPLPQLAHDPATTIRVGVASDSAAVAELLVQGFGPHAGDAGELLASDGAEHLVVERDGAVVGYLRLAISAGTGSVFGFVIDTEMRGRGIGRDVLNRACRRLREHGADRLTLEVSVDNERALGLYTSVGFVPVTTEDYFRLPIGAVDG